MAVGQLDWINWASVVGGLWTTIIVIFVVALLGFAVWWVLRQASYKDRVIILEELASGGTRILLDRGRTWRRSDKTESYQLQKARKAKIQKIHQEGIHVGRKSGNVIVLRKFGNSQYDYYPLGMIVRGLDVNVEPFLHGRENWVNTEIKRLHIRHGGFWEKYGQIIVTFGVLAMALIMIVFIFKMNADTAEMVSSAAQTVAKALGGVGTQEVPPVG